MSPNISTTFAGTIVTFQKYPTLVTLLVSLVRRGRISSIFKSLHLFFKNMGQPRPLFHLFSSFQINITIFLIFTTNKCEKFPSSIWCRDWNSQPLAHESPTITTKTGLPTKLVLVTTRTRYLLYFT